MMAVLLTITSAAAAVLLILSTEVTHCLELTLTYKYLDNAVYNVPLSNSLFDAQPLGSVEFPAPPLIPPPPPSWNSDTNAIIREAIFVTINSQLRGNRYPGWQHNSGLKPTNIDIEDCRQYFMDGQLNNNHSQQQKNNSQQGPENENGSRNSTRKNGASKPRTGPRGPRGPPGKDGAVGPRGPRGADGLPGLVIFDNEDAMKRVQLEGLLAYRSDVRELFLRDNLSWRLIRTSRCGDGIVDWKSGEQCDDGNSDIHDNCTGCRKAYCGDGIHNVNSEECDGRDFGGQSCATYRQGMTGSLVCLPNCIISHQRCRRSAYRRRTGAYTNRL